MVLEFASELICGVILSDNSKEKPLDAFKKNSGGAITIAAFTLLSRVLGLVRDIMLAMYFFGAALDAFVLAFSVPNLFRRLFGEGALSGALVPELVKKIESGDKKDAGLLTSRIVGTILVLLGGIAGVVVIIAFIMAAIFGVDSKLGLTSGLLAIIMPYVVPICAAAAVMGLLNAHRHFAVSASAPALLNVVLITSMLLSKSVWTLAVAVLIGGVLQYVIQLLVAKKYELPLLPQVRMKDTGVQKIGRVLLPTVAGFAAFQINSLLDRVIAEVMIAGDGAVGSLFLANRVVQLPLAIFALSVATAALPRFASSANSGDEKSALDILRSSSRSVLFWILPAATGLALLAEPIIQLIFSHGQFQSSTDALARTSLVLIFYTPGLLAFSLSAIFSRALYARGEAKAVMRASIMSVAVNFILNIVLVLLMKHVMLWSSVYNSALVPEAGLAIASSISGFVYLGGLALNLTRRDNPNRNGLIWGGISAITIVLTSMLAILLFNSVFATGWDWLWLLPKLPSAVVIGLVAGGAVFCAKVDSELLRSHGRLAISAICMGVFVNFTLSSLPHTGEGLIFLLQRVLGPIALGVIAYWFVVGIFAPEEYATAKKALVNKLRRKKAE